MCYEEGFFKMLARKRKQRREKVGPVVEQTTPSKEPSRPAPVPAQATGATKPKETERELELV